MKVFKLKRVLEELIAQSPSQQHATISGTAQGELRLDLNGQPSLFVHQWLLGEGFVYLQDEDAYLYRPRDR